MKSSHDSSKIINSNKNILENLSLKNNSLNDKFQIESINSNYVNESPKFPNEINNKTPPLDEHELIEDVTIKDSKNEENN